MTDEERAREIVAEDRALFDRLDHAMQERQKFEPTPAQARRLIELARLGMMRKAVAAALVDPYEDALRSIEHYRAVESNPGWRLFWAGVSLALEEVSERLGPRDVAQGLADEGWRGPIAEHKEAARTASELISSVRAEEREECAKVADQFGEQILVFWDRPGGPPGNGYRPLRGSDVAAAIRARGQEAGETA